MTCSDNNTATNQRNTRDSGIELLKIVAIFIIVIHHVVQTLVTKNLFITYQGYVLDISTATTNINHIILLILDHFGVWGNSIFFVCSAWFLLSATTYKKKKWFLMLIEIWTVSILILIASFILLKGKISPIIVIKSVFPTLFANNWYLTCYLLFYPISPLLNQIIDTVNKTQLFRITLALSTLYIFLDFIKGDWFFPSDLILWIAIYFIIAYMKKYLMHIADNIKLNVICLFLNVVCLVTLIILTEIAGLKITSLFNQMLHWERNSNPFIIFASIAMFNIARNLHFTSKIINYISSLSLLIYIIHENIIMRTYFRPAIWNYIYLYFGYNHVIEWVFILSVVVFLFGAIAAALYSATIQKVVKRISYRLYDVLKKQYLKKESKWLEKY